MTEPPQPIRYPANSRDTPQEKVILVVDDEPDILELFSLYLEESLPEVRVVTAPTGPKALEVLRSQRVDLIISDFRMPLMDGIEFLAIARTQQPDAVRILFTAYSDEGLAQRATEEAGVHAFYSKDLPPKELVLRLGTLLVEGPAAPSRP